MDRYPQLVHRVQIKVGTGAIRDRQVIIAFEKIFDIVARRLREVLGASEHDPVTQDLLTSITAEIEKKVWMIRARR